MHGIVRPEPLPEELRLADRPSRARQLVHGYRWFLMLVVLPTLLVAAYYFLIASNQYESQADFVVRRADVTPERRRLRADLRLQSERQRRPVRRRISSPTTCFRTMRSPGCVRRTSWSSGSGVPGPTGSVGYGSPIPPPKVCFRTTRVMSELCRIPRPGLAI